MESFQFWPENLDYLSVDREANNAKVQPDSQRGGNRANGWRKKERDKEKICEWMIEWKRDRINEWEGWKKQEIEKRLINKQERKKARQRESEWMKRRKIEDVEGREAKDKSSVSWLRHNFRHNSSFFFIECSHICFIFRHCFSWDTLYIWEP